MGFKARHRLIIVGACIALAGCALVVAFRVDLDGILRFSDRLAVFPTLEAQYNQIKDRIFATTKDTLLKKQLDDPIHLVRELYAGCITGGFHYVYGTNRPYSDVLADYASAFSGMGWEQRHSDEWEFFSIRTAGILLSQIDPSSPDYSVGQGNFRVVYSVLFEYADPAVLACAG